MRFRRLLPRLLGLILLLALLPACGILGAGADCNDAIFAGLRPTIPANATNVSESCSSGINPTVEATFNIPAQDLAAFQQTVSIERWTSDASQAVAFADEAVRASSIMAGTFGNGAIWQEILIDTSDAAIYKVYYATSNID